MKTYLSASDWTNVEAEILSTLTRALGCSDERMALGSASYLHPNGFLKVELPNALLEKEGLTVRIHYWGQRAITNLHSHRWNMSVKVIHGCYEATDFTEDPEGQVMDKYVCSANDQGRYGLVTAGITRVKVRRKRTLSSGETYDQSAGTIHQIAKRDLLPTISLVACSVPVSEASAVFVPAGENPSNAAGVPVQDSQLREVLERTIAALGNHILAS